MGKGYRVRGTSVLPLVRDLSGPAPIPQGGKGVAVPGGIYQPVTKGINSVGFRLKSSPTGTRTALLSSFSKKDCETGRRGKIVDSSDGFIKRSALQIAAQLPEDANDAKKVIELVQEILLNFNRPAAARKGPAKAKEAGRVTPLFAPGKANPKSRRS